MIILQRPEWPSEERSLACGENAARPLSTLPRRSAPDFSFPGPVGPLSHPQRQWPFAAQQVPGDENQIAVLRSKVVSRYFSNIGVERH